MKRLFLLLALLLPMAVSAMTIDLDLSWSVVTTRENGSPVDPEELTYQAFYAPLGTDVVWQSLPSVPGTDTSATYTDLEIPSGSDGVQVYMLATDSNGISSIPTEISTNHFNVINVPVPIQSISRPGSFTININATIKAP